MLKLEFINYLVCNLAAFCKYQSFRPEEEGTFFFKVKFAVERGEGWWSLCGREV
jgi:hypothetical protein